MDKLKQLNKKWIIGIIAIAFIVFGFMFWNSHKQYNALKDLKVSFSGYDGNGYANYNEDEINNKLIEFIGKKEGLSTDEISEIIDQNLTYESISESTSKRAITLRKVQDTEILLSKSSGLRNGDKVKVTINGADNIPVKNNSQTFIVKGLKKVKSITANDVKKDLNFKFTGIDGLGTIQITSKKYDYKKVTVKHNGHLSNGDTVKINISSFLKNKDSSKLTGSKYLKVKVTKLIDLKKVNGIKAIKQFNDDFVKDQNRNSDFETYKLDKLGTYAFDGYANGGIISNGTSYDTSSKVTIGSKEEQPQLSIFTLYKVTDNFQDMEPDTQYKIYGLQGLEVEDNKIDISTKNDTDDGLTDSSRDSLAMIQKRLEKSTVSLDSNK